MMTPELLRFRNALCILRWLDEDDLRQALEFNVFQITEFCEDPLGGFLCLSDNEADALWKLIEARQVKDLEWMP
jgi:hypothetical protein